MENVIECEELLLRALDLEEMEQLAAGSQEFLKETVLSEVIKIAITEKIKRMRAASKEAQPWLSYWLIQQKVSGQGIGVIGSKYLPDEEGYVELGYAVAPEYRGKGYMTEALMGFLDWLYEFPFCNGARLSIRSANLPSIKVAEKCGFRYQKMEDIYRVYQYDF